MDEYYDIYDKNKNKTGRKEIRGKYDRKLGEYLLIVTGIIINSENKILITQRAEYKHWGLMWECNGGSVKAGETSIEGVIRELKEELGIEFSKDEAIYFKEVRKDMWLFKKDIKIEDIKFPDGESIDAKWVTIDEFEEMFKNGTIIPAIDFSRQDYIRALDILHAQA